VDRHAHRGKAAGVGSRAPAAGPAAAGGAAPLHPRAGHRRLAYISGHGPQNSDGSIAGPFGKVGAEVTVEQGYQAARLTALSMLGSLARELGDLDRITAWVRVLGMVNSAPGFASQPSVINGFSDLILDLFGEAGAHARSAVGMAELPFNMPVEVEAEVQVAP